MVTSTGRSVGRFSRYCVGARSRPGRALRLAHPTVRRHLEDLEKGLGSPLFARSPSGLVPTELALVLRDPAEAMEAAFKQMVRRASDAGGGVAGTVRITASEVIGAEVIPPVLGRLRAEHPGLVFELELCDDVVDVLRRDADIAVRMVRPTQAELIARRAGSVPLGLFAHRRWVTEHGVSNVLEELTASHRLVGYDRNPLLIDALAARGISAERRHFGVRSDSNLAQLAAMRAGLGVGICQVPIAARDPDLVRLLPEFLRSARHMARHPSRPAQKSPRAHVLRRPGQRLFG